MSDFSSTRCWLIRKFGRPVVRIAAPEDVAIAAPLRRLLRRASVQAPRSRRRASHLRSGSPDRTSPSCRRRTACASPARLSAAASRAVVQLAVPRPCGPGAVISSGLHLQLFLVFRIEIGCEVRARSARSPLPSAPPAPFPRSTRPALPALRQRQRSPSYRPREWKSQPRPGRRYSAAMPPNASGLSEPRPAT